MLETTVKYNDKVFLPLIWVVSIVVPILVGILMTPGLIPKLGLSFQSVLPKINAGINSTVSVLLVLGIVFIKQGKKELHKRMMLSAFTLSALFLVVYVLYDLSAGQRPFCEESWVSAPVYYTILVSLVFLSVTIIPLASFSIYRALNENFTKHKRMARITFPLWLYVSVTVVLVYFMIAPCS